jgi:hypothetical protein
MEDCPCGVMLSEPVAGSRVLFLLLSVPFADVVPLAGRLLCTVVRVCD